MTRIFKYVDRKTIILMFLGSLLNGGVALAQPLILSKALSLGKATLTYTYILNFAIYGFSVYLVLYSFMLFGNYVHNIFYRKLQVNMRSALFKKLLASYTRGDDEKITLLTQDMEFLGDNYLLQVSHIIAWSLVGIITALYIVAQNLLLGSIFVFFTVLRPIPQFLYNRRLKSKGDEVSTWRSNYHAQISDSVRGSLTLANNQALEENSKKVLQVSERYQHAIQDFSFTQNLVFFFNGFMVFLSQVLPLTFGFYLSLNGQSISIASLVAMYIAAGQLVNPIQNIMYDVVSMQGTKTIADKIFMILEREPDFVDNKEQTVKGIRRLKLVNLKKSYGRKQILSDLYLDVEMGQKVLIKGPSGSGKSTLFRLISGIDDVDQRELFVECEDSSESSRFKGNIGVIHQSPFLFNETIRYNLTLGQEFSDEALIEVLTRVGLADEFDDVLNVVVKNNGENISGGQRVRLEIARFLLRKKDILLADEVTAALDKDNAKKMREILFSLSIMVLEIAHHIDHNVVYDQVIKLG